MRINRLGERFLLIDVEDLGQVHRLWRALRSHPPADAEEIVAGASSVLVMFASSSGATPGVESVTRVALVDPVERTAASHEIPVVYGGPDMDGICSETGLRPSTVAALHSGREYVVGFIGFSPGFGYLVGGHPSLRVPRLSSPRTSVPAGSVAIAAEFTAVYPQPTPGGWRLIGRSDASMFDPSRDPPSLLSPGDDVRFVPSDAVGPARGWGPAPLPPVTRDYVQIIDSGPLTTVQDGGRIGWAHLGVSRSGAADRCSAERANRLVGNSPSEAVLEATLRGPSIRLGADRLVAITGARAGATVDGIPARANAALRIRSGSEIRVGPVEAGARVYLAFSGGLALDPVLGSRSTDTLSGLGPPTLRSGDRIPLGPERAEQQPGRDSGTTATPRAGETISIRATLGPRAGWIGDRGLDLLAGSVFEVQSTSDRTGTRLSGPPVIPDRREEIPSEGMVPGAVQVPPGGAPIVLLRNHPPTGGYPVAAIVDDDGVDSLAQAPPGVRVRFELA